MTEQTSRKLRQDLSPEQREQAERIGSLTYKSSRLEWDPAAYKFIPSRLQH